MGCGVSIVLLFGVFTKAQNREYCLCIAIYLQFPSSFAPFDVSKYEISFHWVKEDCISGLQTSLTFFISYGTAEMKLAILTFVKTSVNLDMHTHKLVFSTKKRFVC